MSGGQQCSLCEASKHSQDSLKGCQNPDGKHKVQEPKGKDSLMHSFEVPNQIERGQTEVIQLVRTMVNPTATIPATVVPDMSVTQPNEGE